MESLDSWEAEQKRKDAEVKSTWLQAWSKLTKQEQAAFKAGGSLYLAIVKTGTVAEIEQWERSLSEGQWAAWKKVSDELYKDQGNPSNE